MPFVQVNDASIYYEVHGSGPPLVLIAGYTCDHLHWDALLEPLSRSFRVVTFDNRGVGQTTDDGRALSIELLAEDVLGLVAALDLHKPHIVGHSLGGAIARQYASACNGNIGKLVILNSSKSLRKAVLLAFESLLHMRKLGIDFDVIFKAMLPWIYADNFLNDAAAVAARKAAILDNPYPQSIANQQRQYDCLTRFDAAPSSKIQAPTLIAHGRSDVVFLSYEVEALRSDIPDARVVELDCGHASPVEIPDKVCSLLQDFLG